MLWGTINCVPTIVMAAVALGGYPLPAAGAAEAGGGLAAWLIACVVAFALIFAVNSSIHSFLVVHYAKADKVATSVGFYYMSNAVGRLLGTLGSGVLYTYVGTPQGPLAGPDARAGLGACFVAGTLASALAALITVRIKDGAAGLRCGPCVCVAPRAAGVPRAAAPAGQPAAASAPAPAADATDAARSPYDAVPGPQL